MKRTVVVSLLLLLPLLLAAQVNITLTGSVADGSIVAGEVLSWNISVPTGAMVHNELWLDVDADGSANAGIDKLLFAFPQQDGAMGNDGPGDNDGTANGTITTAFPAGIAPAHWVFVVTHTSGNDTVSFQVTALPAPVQTISGTVSVPEGYSKQYFVIEASPDMQSSGMSPFWHALTDVNGDYSIAMGGDPVSMNPWRVRLADGGTGYGRLIPTRRDTTVNVGFVAQVVDFTFVEGTILTGRVLDQDQQPVTDGYPHTHDQTNIEDDSRNFGGNLDSEGYFSIAVPPGNYKLHFTAKGHFDSWWDNAQDFNGATVIPVTGADSAIANLNGTVTRGGLVEGSVRNWGMPANANVRIYTTDHNQVWDTYTGDNGRYDATLNPGTYVVEFTYMGDTQYYDHQSSWPGDVITISGTETFSNVDADFMVGPPPELPQPQIVSVWDYPFDNGRHVYIKWQGIDAMFNMMANEALGIQKYSIWRLDAQDTVFLTSVEAAGLTNYVTVVGTLKDSTKTTGPFMSTFLVSAHMTFNLLVVFSDPMSGYSLDNLAPGIPANLTSTVSGANVVLRWSPNEEEDFKYYTIYRSTTPDFTSETVSWYAIGILTEFTDVGAATGTYYYRLTATDHAGNESGLSLPVNSSGTVAVEANGPQPTAFALHGNYPNPFNPSTTISFDLPQRSHVRIDVYNTLGEVVGRVVDKEMSAGTHTAVIDASHLSTGLYFCRMQAGDFLAVQKMNLIK